MTEIISYFIDIARVGLLNVNTGSTADHNKEGKEKIL